MYVIVLTDRSKKFSWIEVYAFKKTGVIQDKFILRSSIHKQNSIGSGEGTRSSIAEAFKDGLKPQNPNEKKRPNNENDLATLCFQEQLSLRVTSLDFYD